MAKVEVVISGIIRCVPHYIPSVNQRKVLNKHVVSKPLTEIFFIERHVFQNLYKLKKNELWV